MRQKFFLRNCGALHILLRMRPLSIPALCLLLTGALSAQQLDFKSYKTQEDYCFDNPKAPTCIDGKPFKMLELKPVYKVPPTVLTPRRTQPARPAEKPLDLVADWRFAHPRADLLADIDVAALRQSPMVRELLAKLTGELGIGAEDLDKMLAQSNQVNQAWFSIRSGDFLLLLQGRLNLPAGFVKLPNGMTSYRISSNAVVLGREASVLEAVHRLEGPATAPAAAAQRMKELSVENQLWLTGTPALLTQQAKFTPLAADLTGFSLGMRLRDGYRMEAIFKCASAAAAHRLLESASAPPALPDSAMKLTSRAEGASVRITLSIEQAELLRMLDKALAGPKGQQLRAMAAAARKPGPMTIYGLPSGPQQLQSPGKIVPVPATTAAPLGGIAIQGGTQQASAPR